jgi:sugar/nucleoside kinase (ribokinase family)
VQPVTVLVCGHVTLDRVGGALVPGGTAYYAARALAAMGARPLVFTAAGPDFPASALDGIDAEIAPAARTTAFENAYGPDGRVQRVLAAAPPLDVSRLPGSWRGADALLVAPVLGECSPAAVAAAARARVVGACVQGLVREVAADGAVVPRALDPGTALAGVGVAFVGEDEVRGQEDLAGRLAATVPLVAFTLGARGCELRASGRAWRIGVHPAREVDPTGAGDVFAAAFLFALARGDDPPGAARLGAAAASIVVEGRGGEALARAGEAFARAARVPVEPA